MNNKSKPESANEAPEDHNEVNDKNKLCSIRSLKVPRPMSDEDKELYSIIARDAIVQNFGDRNENNKLEVKLKDVIGLVSSL